METVRVEPITFTDLIADKAGVIPVKLDHLPIEKRIPGAAISGVVLEAYNAGWRDGDHIKGVIARKVTREVMLVTDWRGMTFMGVVFVNNDGSMFILTPAGSATFRPEYFDLIELTHRRTAKGKKFMPVIGREARVLREQERYRKLSATVKVKKAAKPLVRQQSTYAA